MKVHFIGYILKSISNFFNDIGKSIDIMMFISRFIKMRKTMEKRTIKEFKKESNFEVIKSIMKINNGYVTSKELNNF